MHRTIVRDSAPTDRSAPVISMWAISAAAPTLFRQATDILLERGCEVGRASVEEGLSALLRRYQQWRIDWETMLLRGTSLLEDNVDTDDGGIDASLTKFGPTIYPHYLAYYALANRFLLALQPHNASALENAAVNAALRVIEFDKLRELDSVTDMCRAFSVSIAHSIQATTMDWTMQQYRGRPNRTIDPDTFVRWNGLLGRSL
jgi:hypothetical protein